jgi:hypothetical protein
VAVAATELIEAIDDFLAVLLGNQFSIGNAAL